MNVKPVGQANFSSIKVHEDAVRGRNLTANILACWKSGSSSMSDVGQWLPGGLGREIRRISDQSHHQTQPGGHEDTQSEGDGLARGLQ